MTELAPRPLERASSSVTLDESGALLEGRYRLLRPLGEGGAGVVYAARDERIGSEVAVKVVRGSARRDEVTLARFDREARAAGKLGHPNIVRVTDVGRSEGGSPFVVMERLAGETLETRIQASGRLRVDVAIEVHVQLADALAAAHAAGVLHRDVKPANVFLTELATGQVLVKLLDFGLAELYEEPGSPRLTEQGLLVGSLAYLAPERLAGEPADARSDVYAIGASLFESLTGDLPFSAPNSMMMRARILDGHTPPVSEVRPEVSDALTDVVRACLARDPAQRPQTAADVRRRLLAAGEAPLRANAEPSTGAVIDVPVTRTSPERLAPMPVAQGPAPTLAESARTTRPWWTVSAGIGVAITTLVALGFSLTAFTGAADTSETDASETHAAETLELTAAAPVAAAPSLPPESASPIEEHVEPATGESPIATEPVVDLETRPARTRRTPALDEALEEVPAAERAHVGESHAETNPTETSPSETSGDEPPSRFDRVLEPDWGAPLP